MTKFKEINKAIESYFKIIPELNEFGNDIKDDIKKSEKRLIRHITIEYAKKYANMHGEKYNKDSKSSITSWAKKYAEDSNIPSAEEYASHLINEIRNIIAKIDNLFQDGEKMLHILK